MELGCGVGRDGIFFAQQGHHVLATDASDVVIEQDQERFSDSSVSFEVMDMREPFPYPAESFDVVYANLSLHYYTHEETRRIVERVAEVLKLGGVFAFSCKSVDNTVLGNGEEVEKDVFVSETGHARHLFSEPYTRLLLNGLFQIDYLHIGDEDYNGTESNILQCVATKPFEKQGGL